jgi:hypothetical protein
MLVISERAEQCSVITQNVDRKLVHLFTLVRDEKRDKYGGSSWHEENEVLALSAAVPDWQMPPGNSGSFLAVAH